MVIRAAKTQCYAPSPKCIAVCCSVLQCCSVWRCVWQCVTAKTQCYAPSPKRIAVCCSVWQYCSVWQCVTVCGSILHQRPSATVHHRNVLQCVVVCGSVLQCLAVSCSQDQVLQSSTQFVSTNKQVSFANEPYSYILFVPKRPNVCEASLAYTHRVRDLERFCVCVCVRVCVCVCVRACACVCV